MAATDVDVLRQEILAETRKLSEAYQARFAGDAEGELRAWLHVAARREAMVGDFYGRANREYRLAGVHAPAGLVARDALTLIWQQEKDHTTFVEVRLKEGDLKGQALSGERQIWLGTIDSKTLGAVTGHPGLKSVLGKMVTRLGALLTPGLVPDFALTLDELETREFFLLCSVLETTARQSYARMEQLADGLADRNLQFEGLSRELRRVLLDEAFHEQAFQAMAGWIVDGRFDPALDESACVRQLRRLLPRGARAGGDQESRFVLTDGGLGKLFEKRGMPVVVG